MCTHVHVNDETSELIRSHGLRIYTLAYNESPGLEEPKEMGNHKLLRVGKERKLPAARSQEMTDPMGAR